MTLALLLSLLAAGGPDALRDSQTRYEAGDFEGALVILDAAVRAAPASPRTGLLQVARARCLNALRRNADIDPALEAALAADPTVALGADDSPGLRATFERVRARLAGKLSIESEPPGAAVRIDGAMVGRAPVTQLLPVGRYRISVLDEAGAEAAAQEVIVAPRQPQTIVLKVPVAAPPVQIQAPPEVRAAVEVHWPLVPTFAARVLIDPRAGAAIEIGLGVLARYWLFEIDAVGGGAAGVGARAGARIAFLDGWVAVQGTLDGVAFFRQSPVLGGGGTLSFVVRPVSFFDVSLDGSARFLQPSPIFRTEYGLVGVTLRLRWPNRLAD